MGIFKMFKGKKGIKETPLATNEENKKIVTKEENNRPDLSEAGDKIFETITKTVAKKNGDKIHGKSLLCIFASLAGYAAQYVTRTEEGKKYLSIKNPTEDDLTTLAKVESPSGDKFYVGKIINTIIFGGAKEDSLFSYYGSAIALCKGFDPIDFYNVSDHYKLPEVYEYNPESTLIRINERMGEKNYKYPETITDLSSNPIDYVKTYAPEIADILKDLPDDTPARMAACAIACRFAIAVFTSQLKDIDEKTAFEFSLECSAIAAKYVFDKDYFKV